MPPDNLLQLLQSQMATTQAVSTGVANDEINELIAKDSQQKQQKQLTPDLLAFIRNAVSEVGEEWFPKFQSPPGVEPENTPYGQAIAQIVKEHGSPFINQMTLEQFKERGMVQRIKGREGRAFFTTAKPVEQWGEWSVNPQGYRHRSWEQVRGKPDTVHINPGNIDDLLAEIAHSKQVSGMSQQELIDSQIRTREERRELGGQRYRGEETVEGYAHNVIQPAAEERLFETLLDSLSAPITVESLFQNR